MATQTINISLPKELLKKVDKAAKAEFASRSDYIRQALVGRLQDDFDKEWEELESIMQEAGENARKRGYITEEDFVRAVKEVRRERLAEDVDNH